MATFVAIDADGKSRPIPPLVPESEEDRRRAEAADARRAARLALRAWRY